MTAKAALLSSTSEPALVAADVARQRSTDCADCGNEIGLDTYILLPHGRVRHARCPAK